MRIRLVLIRQIIPPYKSKIPKGGFGALWRVFLRYLSSRKERYRPRRDQRLDAVSELVKTQQLKTIAPGGRKKSREVSKPAKPKNLKTIFLSIHFTT